MKTVEPNQNRKMTSTAKAKESTIHVELRNPNKISGVALDVEPKNWHNKELKNV